MIREWHIQSQQGVLIERLSYYWWERGCMVEVRDGPQDQDAWTRFQNAPHPPRGEAPLREHLLVSATEDSWTVVWPVSSPWSPEWWMYLSWETRASVLVGGYHSIVDQSHWAWFEQWRLQAEHYTYQARETDVRAETLEQAASLLVLCRDTLWIIDGAGPGNEAPPSEPTEQGGGGGTEAERDGLVSQVPCEQSAHETTREAAGDSALSARPIRCAFSGVIPIEPRRFLDSGIRLVECPDCKALRTLEPHGGALRFKSHGQRKTKTPVTGVRWALRETIWNLVGGERT